MILKMSDVSLLKRVLKLVSDNLSTRGSDRWKKTSGSCRGRQILAEFVEKGRDGDGLYEKE